jgi:hypothetical protein
VCVGFAGVRGDRQAVSLVQTLLAGTLTHTPAHARTHARATTIAQEDTRNCILSLWQGPQTCQCLYWLFKCGNDDGDRGKAHRRHHGPRRPSSAPAATTTAAASATTAAKPTASASPRRAWADASLANDDRAAGSLSVTQAVPLLASSLVTAARLQPLPARDAFAAKGASTGINHSGTKSRSSIPNDGGASHGDGDADAAADTAASQWAHCCFGWLYRLATVARGPIDPTDAPDHWVAVAVDLTRETVVVQSAKACVGALSVSTSRVSVSISMRVGLGGRWARRDGGGEGSGGGEAGEGAAGGGRVAGGWGWGGGGVAEGLGARRRLWRWSWRCHES